MANLPTRGRPKSQDGTKRISLKESSYNLWMERKNSLRINGLSNSEFAEILLHQSMDELRGRCQGNRSRKRLAISEKRRPTSTPSKPAEKTPGETASSMLSSFPLLDDLETSSEVDVTGVSNKPEKSFNVMTEIWPSTTNVLQGVNPYYSSILGNPFEGDDDESDSDVSSGSHSSFDDESDLDSEIDFVHVEDYFDSHLEEGIPSDSATLTALESEIEDQIGTDTMQVKWDESNEQSILEVPSHSETLEVMEVDNCETQRSNTGDSDCSVAVDQHTTRDLHGEAEMLEETPCTDEPEAEVETLSGPCRFVEYKDKIEARVKRTFQDLKKVDDSMKDHKEMLEKERVVVEVGLIERLFEGQCPNENCREKRKILRKNVESGVLTINYTCSQGHHGIWHSSSILCQKRHQTIFLFPVVMSTAILLSGNNFEKLAHLAKCLKLSFVSQSGFTRIQSLYAVPSIAELWKRMKDEIWNIYKEEPLLLCGDGRMDSPGFCAKYCMYTMMDHFLHVIVDLEIVDKREAGGASTLMEKMGCKRILERVFGVLNCSEVVTDASSTIMKMVRELKAKNPQVLGEIFHSLDIWHKSVKLTAKISKAAKKKDCELLKEWVQPVRNHFWHCAEQCRGDIVKLKESWIGIIHHVCGEHEWEEGECDHGPMTEQENDQRTLAKNSKAATELRKIIFDPKWLRSLQFYVFFRHTSTLENFHSMMLKYVPKRVGFSYEIFTARSILAALDHNFNLFRDITNRYHKLYSKRSKNWRAEPVKAAKTYDYLTVIMADVLKRKVDDTEPVVRRIEVSPANPKNLAPTIALRAAPPTSELVKTRMGRMRKESKDVPK